MDDGCLPNAIGGNKKLSLNVRHDRSAVVLRAQPVSSTFALDPVINIARYPLHKAERGRECKIRRMEVQSLLRLLTSQRTETLPTFSWP